MRILNPSKRTVDFTRKLPAKQYKQVMGAVMDLLQNPTPYDSNTLEGYKNLYRKEDYERLQKLEDAIWATWALEAEQEGYVENGLEVLLEMGREKGVSF
jgi:hypothetical protein